MRKCGRDRTGGGFSLVELLVVIGIIAILIALLLPALSRAKQQSVEVKCAATLSNIGKAGQLHANDHSGFFPLAGWQWAPTNGVVDAEGLTDSGRRKYDYYDDGGVTRPLPIGLSLAKSMGVEFKTASRQDIVDALASVQVQRLFRCDAEDDPPAGWTMGAGDWHAPPERSSYIWNEAVLGRRDLKDWRNKRVEGLLTRINSGSSVMLAMDGRPRNQTNDNWSLAFDNHAQDTLYDFKFTTVDQLPEPNGFGGEWMDLYRHRGKANVLFVDGHVESVPQTDEGMKGVGISRGVY